MKTVGDTLPSLELQDQNGKAVPDSDLRGYWMELYWYARDMTPGLPQEALA